MSSKTKVIYAAIFVILLIISIKAGFALKEDFNAYAPSKTLYVCACSDAENLITLENTGDVASVYGITQSGSALNYSAINPTTFSLKPGESKEVHNFIGAPCGIEGSFDLTTTVDTAFGSAKEIVQAVDIRQCVNVDVIQTEKPTEVCPCSPVRYDFVVKNTGDFAETYNISVTPFPEYVTVSENLLVLGPGQSKEIYVFVATPCGIYGDMDFSLVVGAQRSNVKAELPFNLKINACYDYSVSSADVMNVCKDIRNVAPVIITNNADVANTYFLSTDAAWSFFDAGVITLLKKQAANINLTLYPSAVPEGTYNLTLRSVSERGEMIVDKSVSTIVENCYSLAISVDTVPDLASCEEYTLLGHALNDGSRESIYTFSLFGEPWASLGTAFSSVKSGESRDIPILLKAPCNETGLYGFALTANVTNFPEKVMQQKFDVNVVAIEEAYAVEINSAEEKIETNYDGNVIQFDVSSIGIRGGRYDIFLNTTEGWISIDRTAIDIAPGETATINLVLSPTNETMQGKYDVSITAIPEGQNVGYERSFSVKLRDKTPLESLIDSWLYILSAVLFIVLLVVLLLLVSRKRKVKEEEAFWQDVEGAPSKIIAEEQKERILEIEKKDRGWARWLLLILGLLVLLGAIAAGIYFLSPYFMVNANETNVSEVPYQETENLSYIEAGSEETVQETATEGIFTRAWNWLFGERSEAAEAPQEVPLQTEQTGELMIENATIYVNRTGLRGSGDVIEVMGLENITIPLTIQNNYEPNIFRIRVNEDVDWISIDKETIQIAPNEKEVVNIIVMPDDRVEEGNYKIDIRIDVEGRRTPISEEIVLKVTQEKPFYLKYLWYALAGIAVLIILGIIVGAKGWLKKRKERDVEEFVEKTKKKKEVQEDILKESRDYGRLKYMVLGIVLILVLAGLIYGGLYAVKSFTKVSELDTAMNETDYQETMPEEAGEGITEETPVQQKADYEKVFIKKGEVTLVPLKVYNANETATFQIRINEDIEWITVDADQVEILPNESKTVNLVASPDEIVDDGNYQVTVDVEVAGQDTKFSQGFILQVRKSPFSATWSYILYALAGIAVLLVILGILRVKEKKSISGLKEGSAAEGDDENIKSRKGKTDIKLK